jgi:hypothetical protein
MKFLFDDESFSFKALRATGFADYGGAELGEFLVTFRQIPEGDEAAWSAHWAATGGRVERNGRSACAARGCLPASQCAAPPPRCRAWA